MPDEDGTAVVAQLAELVADLERQGIETDAGLRELVARGAAHVPGANYAGITLAEAGKTVVNVVATHRYVMLLDTIQNEYGEGPCLTAAWEHHVTHVKDLSIDQRWPNYQHYALANTPIRSIFSFELFIDRSKTMAALNFYAHDPNAFDDESIELGGAFASHIALAWSMMRRHDQFRSALASRDMIGQAKGIIMERFNLDALEAFDLLARLSQQSNRKLIGIARELIETEHPIKRRHE